MPRYSIDADPDELTIQLTDVGGEQESLLAAFQECRDGRCTCPTNEYEKLRSFEVDEADGDISVRLRSLPGARLDPEEIGRCVEHTLRRSAAGEGSDEEATDR